MKNEECGQVTIFLSLLLISFLLILSVCLEGIYLHIQKGRIAQQQAAAGEYAQANYHKELLEQYHIFAIDGRYGAKMEASLKRNWTYHTGNAPSVLHISNAVAVTGSDGQVLRHQIREYMKYAESAKLLDQIKDSLSGVKEEAETDSIKNQVEHIKEEDSDQEVQVEEQPVQDPRKGLKKLLSEGLLPLVMPEGKNISEQAVNIVYGKKDGTKEVHTVAPVLGEKASHNGKVVYTMDFVPTPHQLRHTYITNLLLAGVDVKTVQYLAGHEHARITLDIYAHLTYNRPEDLKQKIDSAFGYSQI